MLSKKAKKKKPNPERRARRFRRSIEKRQRIDKAAFLTKLREIGTIEGAVDDFWRSKAVIYRWFDSDPQFKADCDEAISACYGKLRKTMIKRALEGSDSLAQFLAKARWPKEFRERSEIDIRNDAGLKNLLTAVAFIFKEYVPRERVRDALARLCALTGFRPPDMAENTGGLDGVELEVPAELTPAKRT